MQVKLGLFFDATNDNHPKATHTRDLVGQWLYSGV
jgi:hypothetical protein